MTPLNELKSKVEELHAYGENIVHLTNELIKTISALISSHSSKETSKELQLEEKTSTTKSVSLSEVRHRLSMLAQAGLAAEAKTLITRYNAKKLSELEPSIYNELLAEIDAMLEGKPSTQSSL